MFPNNPHFDDNDHNNEENPLIFFPSDFSSPFTFPPHGHLIFQQPPPEAPPPPAAAAPAAPATQELRNVVHRDVERQRRKEMANLHGSLRSLLPSHYIKGKRAVSDHMQAATDYIRELQRRTKELGAKRDELKSNSTISKTSYTNDEASSSSRTTTYGSVVVLVQPCLIGMEVMINGNGDDHHQLSRVLKLLMEQGLNVVTFDSVRVNDRLIHTIQSEVSDSSCIDAAEIQRLLMRELQTRR
ncbi:Transcription factor bHLH120 [Linum perenne]